MTATTNPIGKTVKGRRFVSTADCIATDISILLKAKKRTEDLLGAFETSSSEYLNCVATIDLIADAIVALTGVKESVTRQKETRQQIRK